MRVVRWAGILVISLVVLGALGLAVALRTKRAASSAVEEVAPGVYHVRNFLADVYGSRVGDSVVLFDAGMDPGGRALDDLLAALHATRTEVRHVFLSHGHFDHVAGAGLFPNALVHVGRADAPVVAQREACRPFTPCLLGAVLSGPPLQPNAPLEAQAHIDVGGGQSVLALPFPGHTPGSFLFLFDAVLFTGDSIQLENGALTPANPHFSVDAPENQASIRSLERRLAGVRVDFVCTGHMWCTKPGTAAALLQRLIRR